MKEFAKQLKRERELRSWSQEQVAEMVGTTSTNVSRWERRITFPNLYFRQQLCELFGKSTEELGLLRASPDTEAHLLDQKRGESPPLPVSRPGASPLLWHLPQQRNPLFTGREEILLRLQKALNTGSTAALTQIQAISGLGGIGKTQTALEYAYRSIDAYHIVLWMRAETRAVLVSDVVAIAEELDLTGKEEQKQYEAIKAVKRWLHEQTGWLLILDNIEELSLLRELLPSKITGHVLLTTRSQSSGPHIQSIDLEKMRPEEGALFLLRRAKRLGPKDMLELASLADRSMATAISQLMDGLPLALDQAGAYIEETACGVSRYFDLFQGHHAALLGLRDLSGGMNADHPLSVSATLSLSLERIKRANPAAFDLLQFCAFLHPDTIPEELFLEGGVELTPLLQDCVRDPLKLDATIAELRRYSLIQRDPDAKNLSLHRLVQVVVKDKIDETAQRQWATRAVQAVNRLFPHVEYWVTSSLCQRYFSQAQACVALIEAWDIMGVEAERLLGQVARYCYELALYAQAEPLLRKALAMLTQRSGETYPDGAEAQQVLGWLYTMQGKYAQAALCCQQALAMHEQAPEPDHAILAGCLADLACIYHKQGQYMQAEPLFQRALAIREQFEGPEHLHVAADLHNLGACYRDQGKYSRAEPLLRQALNIHQKALGMEHVLTATSLNALGKLYLEQGQNVQAEPLLRRAFELRKVALGAEHPQTVQALQDLVKLSAVQAHQSEAQQQVSLDMFNNHENGCEEAGRCLQNVGAGDMQRHELTDEQWEKLVPLVPPQKTGRKGRPAADHRTMINGILWIDKTGTPWRDLPKRYGKWQSVSSRLYRWRQAGIWQRVLATLQQEV
jgi:tetratricopeptide (TPR) repeat protein/DNA-binding XRE family transcriptional regulator